MKMSTKGRYGLRLMAALAARYGTGPVGVDTVAREQAISANYVHVLMGTLKSAGLVRSTRGPSGGYQLAREPSTITALDVISALEGETMPIKCVADSGACPRSSECPTRDVWCQIAASVDGILKGMTLQALAETHNDNEAAVNYCI